MEVFQTFFYTLADIVLIFLHVSQLPGFLKSAYKDSHISYVLKDDQIPSFTSKRILYLQEYMQPVGDLVLQCNTFRMLVPQCFLPFLGQVSDSLKLIAVALDLEFY